MHLKNPTKVMRIDQQFWLESQFVSADVDQTAQKQTISVQGEFGELEPPLPVGSQKPREKT